MWRLKDLRKVGLIRQEIIQRNTVDCHPLLAKAKVPVNVCKI
jgi:hypothetical protein